MVVSLHDPPEPDPDHVQDQDVSQDPAKDPVTVADVQGLEKVGVDVPDLVRDVDALDLEIDVDRGLETAGGRGQNLRNVHANHVPNLMIEKVEKRMRNFLRLMRRSKKKRLKIRTKKKHLLQRRKKLVAKMTTKRRKKRIKTRIVKGTVIEIGIVTEIRTEIGTGIGTEIGIVTAKDVALVLGIKDVDHVQETEIGTAANGLDLGIVKEVVAGTETEIRKNRQVRKRSRETTIRKKEALNIKTNPHLRKALTLKPKIWTFQILLESVLFGINALKNK